MPRAPLYALAAVAALAAWTVAASAAFLWGTGLWGAFPYPSTQWWAYLPHRAHPTVARWLLLGALAGAAPLLVAFGTIRNSRRKSDLHGKSDWLGLLGAWWAGFRISRRPDGRGILMGKLRALGFWFYVSLPPDEHGALNAPTGTGKGVSFSVPNALAFAGSLVCYSVKRDIWEAAAHWRRLRGDDVFLFDISDPDRCTHRWNPLGYVRRGQPETHGDIYRAFWFLVPETKANNPFWDHAARKLAAAVGVVIAETPGMALNVAAVLDAVRRPDWASYLGGMLDRALAAGRPYPKAAADVIRGMIARQQEQPARDVLETLTTALALWNDPIVRAATEVSDFDLSVLRSRPMSIFITASPADLRIYRPIYGLLFQQLVQLNTRQEYDGPDSDRRPRLRRFWDRLRGAPPPARLHSHRVLGLLDEFWALGKQDVLADASAFTRSYGFTWAYVQQDETQSVTAFGKEGAENLFRNTGGQVFFGGIDEGTAKKVSERMGYQTVIEATHSKPLWGFLDLTKHSRSEGPRRRALMLPQEIMWMDARYEVVLRRRARPLRLHRILYYRDPCFRHLGGKPPAPPPLTVTVERDAGAAVAP